MNVEQVKQVGQVRQVGPDWAHPPASPALPAPSGT
jgi:hypothetical protein